MNEVTAQHVFRIMYAIRVTLSFAAAWVVSYYFDLDRPYWALMTVVVVSMPSQGAMIGKFFARLAGTTLGAAIVNFIAAFALGDPWLMSIWLITWLALCTYAATCYTGMPAYAFALSGYTGSILGFALSVSPTAYTVYYFTQARVAEIFLGLACALMVAFLLPSSADREKLKKTRNAAKNELLALFKQIALSQNDGLETQNRFETLSRQLVEIKQLALQDQISPAINQKNSSACADAAAAQLHVLSLFFPLRSLYATATRDPALDKQALDGWLDSLAAWVETSEDAQAFPTPPKRLQETPEGRRYASLLRETAESLAHFRRHDAFASQESRMPASVYRDHVEATLNVCRIVAAMLAGTAFWLWTQWDIGYMLPVLLGISFSLGVTYPKPEKLVFLVIAAAVLGIAVSAVYQFIIYIQADALEPVMIVTLPFIFIVSYLKTGSMVSFIFWHICTLSVIFLNSYENMMQFDFSRFVNTSVAAVFSASVVALLLHIFPLSKPATKFERMKKEIRSALDKGAQPLAARKKRHVESLIYSAIAQAGILDDAKSKEEFIRFVITAFSAIADVQTGKASEEAPSSQNAFSENAHTAAK